MKKIPVVFLLVCLISCQNQDFCHLRYDDIPVFYMEEYNTCNAIIKNFSYENCWADDDIPLWYFDGDTIKVCGYVCAENWNGDKRNLPLCDKGSSLFLTVSFFDNTGDSQSHLLPETILPTDKFFVTGRLHYVYLDNHLTPIVWDIQDVQVYNQKDNYE